MKLGGELILGRIMDMAASDKVMLRFRPFLVYSYGVTLNSTTRGAKDLPKDTSYVLLQYSFEDNQGIALHLNSG